MRGVTYTESRSGTEKVESDEIRAAQVSAELLEHMLEAEIAEPADPYAGMTGQEIAAQFSNVKIQSLVRVGYSSLPNSPDRQFDHQL